jgi:predicted RNA-binding protein YlqC (UPF0109 family)
MVELVHHLVRGIVRNPDSVEVTETEGEASLTLGLRVHPDDVEAIHGPGGETLRSLRIVLSASSGQRRAVLELVNDDEATGDEPTGE